MNPGLPHNLVEIKSPEVKLKLTDLGDQTPSHVIEIISSHPTLRSLSIIITNGWELIVGNFFRSTHSDIEINIIDQIFQLYEY